jgi:nickel/cobalt exporter
MVANGLAWALLLGFGLGLRHAMDPDHVAAVGTLLQRETSASRAVKLAALWGLGHTFTFLGVGAVVVVAGVRVPPNFEHAAEGMVAIMLVVLGVLALVGAGSNRITPRRQWRPLMVGVVHGLAGSAGVALLALATIPSTLGAFGYLFLFGVGTVAGMMAVTALLSLPVGWSLARYGQASRLTLVAAAVLSIALGVSVGVRVIHQASMPGLLVSSHHTSPLGDP